MLSVITHHSSKPREQKNRELWSTLTRTGRAQVDNVTNQLIVLFTEVQKSVHKLILTMLFTTHGPTQTRSVCFAFFTLFFHENSKNMREKAQFVVCYFSRSADRRSDILNKIPAGYQLGIFILF